MGLYTSTMRIVICVAFDAFSWKNLCRQNDWGKRSSLSKRRSPTRMRMSDSQSTEVGQPTRPPQSSLRSQVSDHACCACIVLLGQRTERGTFAPFWHKIFFAGSGMGGIPGLPDLLGQRNVWGGTFEGAEPSEVRSGDLGCPKPLWKYHPDTVR